MGVFLDLTLVAFNGICVYGGEVCGEILRMNGDAVIHGLKYARIFYGRAFLL